MSILILFSLQGCRQEEVPDPQRTTSKLLQGLYRTLAQKDYNASLKKLKKLRQLKPGNVYLAELEWIQINNIVIRDAQKHLDNNNINKAIYTLYSAKKEFGQQKILEKALLDLSMLKKITQRIKILNTTNDARELATAILELKVLIKKYPKAKAFNPIINNKIKEIEDIKKREHRRAIFDLSSDVEWLIDERDSDALILLAELEVEDPKHHKLDIFNNFLKSISDD